MLSAVQTGSSTHPNLKVRGQTETGQEGTSKSMRGKVRSDLARIECNGKLDCLSPKCTLMFFSIDLDKAGKFQGCKYS